MANIAANTSAEISALIDKLPLAELKEFNWISVVDIVKEIRLKINESSCPVCTGDGIGADESGWVPCPSCGASPKCNCGNNAVFHFCSNCLKTHEKYCKVPF